MPDDATTSDARRTRAGGDTAPRHAGQRGGRWSRRRLALVGGLVAALLALGAVPVARLLDRGNARSLTVSSAAVTDLSFKTTGFTIHDLPADKAPYAGEFAGKTVPQPTDAQGVRQRLYKGVMYDHPVVQAQGAINDLNTYARDKDAFFLQRAQAQAQRLIDKRTEVKTPFGVAAFYPYPFDFRLHAGKGFTAKAPWYSGMAQGQALSVFSRLVKVDPGNAQKWRTAADDTYRSLLVQPSRRAPWAVHVDDAGYLWLDEYPFAADPGHADLTFNGQNFAVYGLYDYYLLTRDPGVARVFDGALTTSLAYFPDIRNEGWISSYCLLHPEVTSAKYHGIHADQMNALYRITRDPRLARGADELREDYPDPKLGGTATLAAGDVVGRKFGKGGKLEEERTFTLPATTKVKVTSRVRMRNQGIHLLMADGPAAGYMVQETPGRATLDGVTELLTYAPARTLQFTGETTFSKAMTGAAPTAGTKARFDATVLFDGQLWLRLADGPRRGSLVLKSSVRTDV